MTKSKKCLEIAKALDKKQVSGIVTSSSGFKKVVVVVVHDGDIIATHRTKYDTMLAKINK